MITFIVLLVIAILLLLAGLSFARFRQEKRLQEVELRRAVEQKGWRYKVRPFRGIELRITGTTEGIHWTLEQYDPAPADDLTTPTLVWSADSSDTGPMILLVTDHQSAAAMSAPLGRALLRAAINSSGKSIRKLGLSGVEDVREFFDKAKELPFKNQTLNVTHRMMTMDSSFAKKYFDETAENALLALLGRRISVQVNRGAVILRCTSSEFDKALIERLVDLGASFTRRLAASIGQ